VLLLELEEVVDCRVVELSVIDETSRAASE